MNLLLVFLLALAALIVTASLVAAIAFVALLLFGRVKFSRVERYPAREEKADAAM